MRSPFFLDLSSDLQDHLQSTFEALQASRTKKDSATLAATKMNTKLQAEQRAAKEAAAAERERIKQENKAALAASSTAKPSWHFESQDFEEPAPLQRRTSSRLSAPSPATVLRRADSEPGGSQQSVGSVRKAASIDSSQVKRRKRPVIVEESTQELDEGSDEESDELEEGSDEEESQASLTKLMRKSKMASQDSQDLD